MRAVLMERFGGPEVLELVERPTPAPGPGQVLVRVAAAGINFADTLMRRNRYALTPPLPSVLGHEAAGVIERLGDEVTGLRVGTRVAAPLFAAGAWFGGYSEHVVIDAAFVAPLPDGLSFDAANALMVQGLTALHLTRQAPPGGKTVLVNAAAGGVGSLLVQIAKQSGATTVLAAASSQDKIDRALSLGADVGLNYTEPGWVEKARAATAGAGPDIIYESAGGDVTTASLQALAPHGRMLIFGALNIQSFALGVPELLGLIFRNQWVGGFALAPLLTPSLLQEGLRDLFRRAVEGRIQVTVGGRFPLERAAEAHRALEGRKTSGKVVLVA
jgi:NADPH:quinone reductase